MAIHDKPQTVASPMAVSLPALAIGTALLAGTARAAEPAPLDEEFLEYLAQLEGDEDDWTWFEADEPPPAAAKPAARPAPASQPADKVPPAKAPSEVKR